MFLLKVKGKVRLPVGSSLHIADWEGESWVKLFLTLHNILGLSIVLDGRYDNYCKPVIEKY